MLREQTLEARVETNRGIPLVKRDNDVDAFTVLGKGSELDGTLSVEETVRIEGKFTGRITTTGSVVVSPGARVKADIHAGTVLIEGEVEGTVRATSLIELKPPARMIGTLASPDLSIERGVVFVGTCEMKPAGGPVMTRKAEPMIGQQPVPEKGGKNAAA